MNNGAECYSRFLSGDKKAIEEIIRDYKDGLIFYLFSIVGDMQKSEELAIDTFIILFTEQPKFKGEGAFKTWLYAIGRNITAKHLRKHASFSIVPLESQEYLSDEENIESNYIKSEQKRAVHKALHSLKAEYRQVLYLSFFEGFSNEETALIMKKSKRQIETLLYNAKKALRSELERSGFEYEE